MDVVWHGPSKPSWLLRPANVPLDAPAPGAVAAMPPAFVPAAAKECSVSDLGDGRLRVEYGAHVAGAYELRLLCEGRLLRFFDVTVRVAPAEPTLSEVGGGALAASALAPGDHELTISLYDRHRNAAAWPQAGVRVLLLAGRDVADRTTQKPFDQLLTAPPESPLLLPLRAAGTYYLSVSLEPVGTPIGDVRRLAISIVDTKSTVAAPGVPVAETDAETDSP